MTGEKFPTKVDLKPRFVAILLDKSAWNVPCEDESGILSPPKSFHPVLSLYLLPLMRGKRIPSPSEDSHSTRASYLAHYTPIHHHTRESPYTQLLTTLTSHTMASYYYPSVDDTVTIGQCLTTLSPVLVSRMKYQVQLPLPRDPDVIGCQ
jgi:hypothetical protein